MTTSSFDWLPIWALPNLMVDEPVETTFVALVPVEDERVQRACEQFVAIVGPDPISRPKALEAVWKHIQTAVLQRPEDLRIIHADEKLRTVIGTDVITMYALEALIRPHLHAIV